MSEQALFNIVLWQPEIPPNTGNIIRLASNTGSALHLIHPLGFKLEDKALKRAGLDYIEWENIQEHEDIHAFFEKENPSRIFACTTKSQTHVQNMQFEKGDYFLFGPESRGLSPEVLNLIPQEFWVRLPMVANNRSLNLSNATAVMIYLAWSQLGFQGAA
jgi:tRNA (cytidine/uridine-2'-O-)-methyltransferase